MHPNLGRELAKERLGELHSVAARERLTKRLLEASGRETLPTNIRIRIGRLVARLAASLCGARKHPALLRTISKEGSR